MVTEKFVGTLGWVSRLVGPFDTFKVVRFRSTKLSITSKGATFAILLYVIGYNLLYSNRHFVKSRPNGIGRLQLQRPTKDHCNPNHADCEADFTPLEDLSYCQVYNGTEKAVGKKQACKYFDEKMMNPSGKTDTSMLIPTRTTATKQKKTSLCATDGPKDCTNIYAFTDSEEETVYVADIERFTLLIDHAFMVPFEDRKLGAPVDGGASTLYQGYFEVCEDPFERTGCREIKIPCFSGCHVKTNDAMHRRLEEEASEDSEEVVDDGIDTIDIDSYKPNFFSIKVGDIIPMKDLLLLAGVDLNTDENEFGESRRYEGSVLQIDIDYINIEPFMWPPWKSGNIRYVYRVSLLPMGTFKEVSESFEDGGDTRVLQDWHGIFVRVSLTGSISYVSVAQFILVMTTSLGLLAAADSLVHACAMSPSVVGKETQSEYVRGKYDSSLDFDKNTVFEDSSSSRNTWARYEKNTPESMEAFVDDFKSNDGETISMAAHLIWELYQKAADHHKDAISRKVSAKNLTEKIDDGEPAAATTVTARNRELAVLNTDYTPVSQSGP